MALFLEVAQPSLFQSSIGASLTHILNIYNTTCSKFNQYGHSRKNVYRDLYLGNQQGSCNHNK